MINKCTLAMAAAILASLAVWQAFLLTQENSSAVQHLPGAAPLSAPEPGRAVQDSARKPAPEVSKAPLDTAATTSDRQTAEPDAPAAQVALGDRYLAGIGVQADASEALRWYQKAAEQGDAGAQLKLGFLYEQGLGVEKSADKALELFGLAADQGNAAAQANLGDRYEFGEGIRSPKAAAHYYRLAAQQGFLDAQLDLGRLYEFGKGVPQDPVQAWRWYALAAQQGDASAARHRDRVSLKMRPAEITEAQQLVGDWQRSGARPMSQPALESRQE